MQASFLINSYVPAYIDYYKFTGAKIMSLFQKYGSIVNVPWGEEGSAAVSMAGEACSCLIFLSHEHKVVLMLLAPGPILHFPGSLTWVVVADV